MSALDVLMVEDDAVLVRSYERLFSRWGWTVDSCSTLAEAKRTLSRKRYDVALLDIKLPDGQATDLLGPLRRGNARPAVVVMSAHYEAQHALLMMGRCDAFVPKPAEIGVLRQVMERAATAHRGRTRPLPVEAYARHHGLSGRETELLILAAEGLEDDAICTRLAVQGNTLKTYWKRIFKKTGEHTQRSVMGAVLRFTLGGSGRRGPSRKAKGRVSRSS
ncbi:MAG: response regulator transcription factor [Myxococcota bacterium]